MNDYLVKRDSEWMGQIYRYLGLQTGFIQNSMPPEQRRLAYAADVTYGTNNEFGFDYLRDNMVTTKERLVQRGHHFAVVDEVDSILIDEARTPLIISGAVQESAEALQQFARISPRLTRDVHYEVDEKKRTIAISEEGIAKVEEILGVENLYDHVNVDMVHHLEQSIRGQGALQARRRVRRRARRGQDRRRVHRAHPSGPALLRGTSPGDRSERGRSHQGGEPDSRHDHSAELLPHVRQARRHDRYGPHRGGRVQPHLQARGGDHPHQPPDDPSRRAGSHLQDRPMPSGTPLRDDLEERHEKGQPVLIGTVSVEKSEVLSRVLSKQGVPHTVLNAKHHEKEAAIVAQAGRLGAVTVATNMAGRGVDIVLGGNAEGMAQQEMIARGWDDDSYMLDEYSPEDRAAYEGEFDPLLEKFQKQTAAEHEEVLEADGLYVLGTERHDSRRIDNQLRGRSGRQGDPGESRFYLSLEDDLMRLFASDRIAA